MLAAALALLPGTAFALKTTNSGNALASSEYYTQKLSVSDIPTVDNTDQYQAQSYTCASSPGMAKSAFETKKNTIGQQASLGMNYTFTTTLFLPTATRLKLDGSYSVQNLFVVDNYLYATYVSKANDNTGFIARYDYAALKSLGVTESGGLQLLRTTFNKEHWRQYYVAYKKDLQKTGDTLASTKKELAQKKKDLTASNKQLKAEVKKLEKAGKKLRTQKKKLVADQKRLKAEKKKLDAKKSLTDDQQKRLTKVQAKLDQLEEDIATANTKIKDNKSQITADNKTIKANKKELTSVNKKIKSNNKKIKANDKKIKTVNKRIKAKNLTDTEQKIVDAVKLGPTISMGHGQTVSYNAKTKEIWMAMDLRNSDGTLISNDTITFERINMDSLKPDKAIKFQLQGWGSSASYWNTPTTMTFDANGTGYFTRYSKGYYGLFTFTIDKNDKIAVEYVQRFKYGPSAGNHIQGMSYNPKKGTVNMVCNGGIMSFPSSKVGKLQASDFTYELFDTNREFENIVFDNNGYAYLLTTKGPEILVSTSN